MATIRKLRDELKAAKATGARVGELEQKLKEIEDAEKSDLQKAQDKVAELEQQQKQWDAERRETLLRLAIHGKAAELGIADVDVALGVLDRSALDYSDAGEVTNLDEQLKLLLDRHPLLRGAPAPPTPPGINGGDGAGGGPPPPLTADELTAAKTAGMTPEQYALAKTAAATGDVNIEEYARQRRAAAQQQ